MKVENLQLGDLAVVGRLPPTKLLKALAAIAAELHPSFDRKDWLRPGQSKISCVLCALTVRDFLRKVGFTNVRVRPTALMVRAFLDDVELHSVGIADPNRVPGLPKPRHGDTGWNGHLVVEANGWIIDPTLYQVAKPQWNELPGMVAVPRSDEPEPRLYGMPLLAGMRLIQDDNHDVNVAWFDDPINNVWLGFPDAERSRRRHHVEALVQAFGGWR